MVSQRKISVILLSLALSGCSGLGVLDYLKPSNAPSVEANVGGEVESIDKSLVVKEDDISGEKVTVHKAQRFASVTATELIYEERIPFWIWVLMILGWILPSPIEIYRGLGNLLVNLKGFLK